MALYDQAKEGSVLALLKDHKMYAPLRAYAYFAMTGESIDFMIEVANYEKRVRKETADFVKKRLPSPEMKIEDLTLAGLLTPDVLSCVNLDSPSTEQFLPMKAKLENDMRTKCFTNLDRHFTERSLELLLRDPWLNRTREPEKAVLEMWVHIREYEETMRRLASEVWTAYISPSSTRQVNVQGRILKQLKKNIQNPSMPVFREAMKEIIKTLDMDFMPNFALWYDEQRKAAQSRGADDGKVKGEKGKKVKAVEAEDVKKEETIDFAHLPDLPAVYRRASFLPTGAGGATGPAPVAPGIFTVPVMPTIASFPRRTLTRQFSHGSIDKTKIAIPPRGESFSVSPTDKTKQERYGNVDEMDEEFKKLFNEKEELKKFLTQFELDFQAQNGHRPKSKIDIAPHRDKYDRFKAVRTKLMEMAAAKKGIPFDPKAANKPALKEKPADPQKASGDENEEKSGEERPKSPAKSPAPEKDAAARTPPSERRESPRAKSPSKLKGSNPEKRGLKGSGREKKLDDEKKAEEKTPKKEEQRPEAKVSTEEKVEKAVENTAKPADAESVTEHKADRDSTRAESIGEKEKRLSASISSSSSDPSADRKASSTSSSSSNS